jgi:hypothetical protein
VKLPITSRGRFLGPYRLGGGGVREYRRAEDRELIRKLPELWRYSLVKAEPKLSQALICLTQSGIGTN